MFDVKKNVPQNHAPIGPDPPLQRMDTLRILDSEVLDQLQIMNISKPAGTTLSHHES